MTIEKEVIDGTLPFIREKPRDIALVSVVVMCHQMLSDKKAAGEILLTNFLHLRCITRSQLFPARQMAKLKIKI